MRAVRCKNCNTCFETYSKVMQTFHFSKLQNHVFTSSIEGHCGYPKSEFKRPLGLECFRKVVVSQNAIAPMRKEAPGNETR